MTNVTPAGAQAGTVEASPSDTSVCTTAAPAASLPTDVTEFASVGAAPVDAATLVVPVEVPGLYTLTTAPKAAPASWPPKYRTSAPSMPSSAPLAPELAAAIEDEPPATILVPADAPVAGFDSLGLSPDLQKAVAEAGYTVPTPIQAEGIPHVLKRRDIIGIAQTGTGKTASFTLPMIELLARGRAKARMPRSLILEPTRELAAQVAESFEKYGKHNKLSMALLIGGVSFDDQDKKLDRGVDVLIATPGRMLDHFERGKLMLSQVQILVIDEADRMLDMGFIPDVERICKLIPFTRQTLFYSATMPPEIRRLTDQFLHNPVRVEVARPATTAENIHQEIIDVPNNEWAKREALRRLMREAGEIKNAIVFCNRKRDVDIVAKSLSKHGFNAAPLHGDLDQSVRTRTLDAFRSGELALLVASDVAARGLDIPAVSHIFNFDVPFHPDDYVHRVGRTGRAGRSGTAFMLASSRDAKYIEAIEKLTKSTIPHRTLDGLAEAVEARPPRDDRGKGDKRGRDRGRGRDGGKRREHPVKPHHQVAAMEPVKPAAEPLVAQVQEPHVRETRAQEPPAHEHKPRSHAPRPPKQNIEHHVQTQQPRHQQPRPQHREEPKQVDKAQLPAFLLRPVKLPPEKPARVPKKDKAES